MDTVDGNGMAMEMPPPHHHHHHHNYNHGNGMEMEMEPGDGIYDDEEEEADGLYGGTAGHRYGRDTKNRVRHNGYDDVERDMCFEQDYSDLVEDGDGIDDIENAIDDMYDNDNHETDGPARTGGDEEPKIIDLGMKGKENGDDVDKLILDRINTSDLL